ncbi:hypothetical protein ACRAQ6_03310 [Erythrobacter sp. HA6-11]
MLENVDWWMIMWTGAVFMSGYLIGSRKRAELQEPLDFDLASISPTARAQIEQSLQNGHIIEAIRTLRQDTGLGLKDAKTVIDSMR